jgi:deoxyribose-phosphate aldolase
MIEQIERGAEPSPPAWAAAASSPADADTAALTAVEGLSEKDLQRILARMTELGAAGSSPACAELACMFCRICAETNPELVRQLIDAGAERIGQRPGQGVLPTELAKYIDHTLLRPEATVDEIKKLCAEATEHGFASVCVNPPYVRLAVRELVGSLVGVCAVAGFPLGAHVPEIKAMEARRAIREGAQEIDMVINVGALKSGDHDLVYRDILGVTDACSERAGVCKVIIEAALLTDDEKITACQLAKKARADFVKTSTGFGPGGATVHDVALMRDAVGDSSIGVKAAGGIRTLEDARKMIEAGATRIGASAGVKILKEAKGAPGPG